MKLHSTISCHLLHDFVPPGPSPLSVSLCFLLQELIGGPYTVTAMDKVDSFPEIDDLRLPDSLSVQRVDTPIIEELRARREKRFALGPIPLGWWKACHEADPNGLSLALGLLMESCCRIIDRQKWVVVSDMFGRQLGLSRNQRHRAVAGLDVAGLIEVKRKPNHAARVRLVPWRERKNDK